MDSIRLGNHKEELEKKEGVKLASEALQALSKVIKTLKIYPDTNPLRQRFISELTGKFTRFLDEHGDLTLKVKQSELLYLGEVVYTSPSKEENIAFRLYGDGIRDLIFTEGLEEKEILGFIEVVTGSCTDEGEDDDTVTRLWEKDFRNIRYTVVEEGEESEKPPVISEQAKKAEKSREALLKAYRSETGGEPQSKTLLESPDVEIELEHLYGKPFVEIFALTPEEIEKIQHEMEMEEGMDLITELLDILFHILQIERELDSYSEIIKNIGKALSALILAGDYRRVIPILATLKTLSRDENNFSPSHAQEVQKAIDALGDEEFLNQIALAINVKKIDDIEALFSFLTLLNSNAIIPLAGMVGTLDQMKTRRLFCDALAILARDNIGPLFQKLEDDNWYVVRNIVYVLGKIGNPKSVQHLKKIQNHPEQRVRKEIVHALKEIKSEEAKEFLIHFLADSDDGVRIMALKNLAALGYQKAVPAILDAISSDLFESREVYEKKEFFDVLGRLGSGDILPYLKELLMKRTRLFGKSKVEEHRVYAALALKRMGTPEAMEILREGRASSDKGIRRICEDTLQEMEKEMR